MAKNLETLLEELRDRNQQLRRRAEFTEAQVESVNHLLREFHKLGTTSDEVLLGDVVLRRAYDVVCDLGSAQVIQAAISFQGGFGAVFWDSEELAVLHGTPELYREARLQHLPFEQCDQAAKAYLSSQVEPLLESLLGRHEDR